jgi:alkylation response protein AidB-like acyl-CoA dehydrogenase
MSHASLHHDVVAAALKLMPDIRARHDELATARRVPPALVQAIAEAGLLQLHLPRSMGGSELPPLTTSRVIEEFSRVDGSVGWCTMIANSVCFFVSRLRAEVGRELFGQPPDVRIAGSLRPEGKAYIVDGGYRVQGRWDFASGIDHARWLLCTCAVIDADGPRQLPGGTPEVRHLLVPAAAATIEDTWSVVGMCGTGSHDFIVDNAAGTNALYRKYPLERHFRDIHAAVQHAAGLPSHYEGAGQVLLGLQPDGLGW